MLNNFYCDNCDYKCSKLFNWQQHLNTIKHKNANFSNNNANKNKQFDCDCGKIFKHQSSFCRHKKTCNKVNIVDDNQVLTVIQNTNPDLNLVMEYVKQQIEDNIQTQKQNQEFQKQSIDNQKQSIDNQMQMFQQMMEFMKQQCVTTTNINNGNIQNNNHNHFNLQFYLNETCKNAMNIDQFIEYLQPTLQELEDTARLGYVEGITRIILRGLKDLEESERPFHCSDLKRETMFVKNNNNIWEKEPDEKPQLMKVVKAISRKNFCNVNAWQKEHPTWKNHDSKQNDQYNKILVNSTSGSTEEEQKNSYEKIIKNIVKETVIDKGKNK